MRAQFYFGKIIPVKGGQSKKRNIEILKNKANIVHNSHKKVKLFC